MIQLRIHHTHTNHLGISSTASPPCLLTQTQSYTHANTTHTVARTHYTHNMYMHMLAHARTHYTHTTYTHTLRTHLIHCCCSSTDPPVRDARQWQVWPQVRLRGI